MGPQAWRAQTKTSERTQVETPRTVYVLSFMRIEVVCRWLVCSSKQLGRLVRRAHKWQLKVCVAPDSCGVHYCNFCVLPVFLSLCDLCTAQGLPKVVVPSGATSSRIRGRDGN